MRAIPPATNQGELTAIAAERAAATAFQWNSIQTCARGPCAASLHRFEADCHVCGGLLY
jgi:hypothetical protein